MQLVYNDLLTKEENDKIDREIDMTPAQLMDETEKWLATEIEEDVIEDTAKEVSEVENEEVEPIEPIETLI
jgi:hypothetical protein